MAQIDFTYNAQDDKKKQVQYFDTDGKLVAAYDYLQFLFFCDRKYDDLENTSEVDKLIDTNWVSLTTEFYNYTNNI